MPFPSSGTYPGAALVPESHPAWGRYDAAIAAGEERDDVQPRAFQLAAGYEGSVVFSSPAAHTFDFDEAAGSSGVVITGDRSIIAGLRSVGVFEEVAAPPRT